MNKKSLYNLGGISAFGVVLILGTLDISTVFGLDFGTGFVPVFSILICVYIVFLIAGLEFISGFDYTLAKIGTAFGALLMVTLFIEVATLSADQIYFESNSSIDPLAISELDALFTSSHTLAVWFHAIWMACWGFALARGVSKFRTIGILMLVFSGIYVIYYLLTRLAYYELAEIVHLIAHIPLLVSHAIMGKVLISANET